MAAKILLAVVIAAASIATVSAAPLMYVPTGGANDLVIIDLDTDKIVGRIDELENAHGLAASPNGKYLVAGSMQPVDSGETRTMARPGSVSDEEHLAHHADSGDAVMKSPSYLSIVHPVHGHVMRRIAVPGLTHHLAVSPNGGYVIAVHSGGGAVSVVDLDQMALVKTIQVGRRPNYAVFNIDGKRLYVSNAGSDSISEIDTRDWTILREIHVGKSPEHIVLSPDGETLYVANVDEGRVVAVRLSDGAVSRSFEVGDEPHGIDISADGRWLFVSSKQAQRLSRIDLHDDSMTAIDLQPAPYHVAYAAAVDKLYVSSRKLPLIWVVNPDSMKVVDKIDIGRGAAHQMVLLP